MSYFTRRGGNVKERESSSFESENPSFRGASLRILKTSELIQPSWFSSRLGSHLDRSTGVLYDGPCYGLQVTCDLQEGWVTDGRMFGVLLYKPQELVYQSKIQVPPWLLFASGPELEGEIQGDAKNGYVLSVDTNSLGIAMKHFKKALRDPSLEVMLGLLGGSESARLDLLVSKPQKMKEWPDPMFKKARLRFNPWFRKQLNTIDFA